MRPLCRAAQEKGAPYGAPHSVKKVAFSHFFDTLKPCSMLLSLGQIFVSLVYFSKHAGMLLGDDNLDNEQGADHKHYGYCKVQPHLLDKAGKYEAYKRYSGNRKRIRQLGEHMIQMEAVRTGGSHDGSIGYR